MFLSRSITSKFIAVLLLLIVVLFGGFYFYFNGQESLPSKVVLIAFIVFSFLILTSFIVIVLKPLKTVLGQIQLALAGKSIKKIFTTRVDEVGIIAHFFNKVTEGFTEVASDIKDRKRMLDELTMAYELQKGIFPGEPPKVDGLEIVAKNLPASEIGGDSYDFIDSKENLYIYVGDVTGHGVRAGLLMGMINAMINSFADFLPTARDIIVNVNKHIKKYSLPSMFMTLVMLSFNKATKKMTYVGAGHEHLLIFRKATGQLEAIPSGGTALGMIPDVSKLAKEIELPFEVGDVIVLYSDGITEAKSKSGELFGLERLKNSFREYVEQYNASGVNYHISKDLADFVGDESQLDDITLIVIQRT